MDRTGVDENVIAATLERIQLHLRAVADEVDSLRASLGVGATSEVKSATSDAASAHAKTEALLARWKAASPDGPHAEDVGASLDQLCTALFSLSLQPDGDDAFQRFIALFHSDDSETPNAVHSLRTYTWPHFRKFGEHYLREPNTPASFQVVRRDPEEAEPSAGRAKWFFWNAKRSPAPVTFRRDEARGARWRITQCSL